MKIPVSREKAKQLFEEIVRPKIIISSTGCWEVPIKDNGKGYKAVHIRRGLNTRIYVHRLSYLAFVDELDDLQVLHKCDNRGCCNYEHLFKGTQLDNIRDMDTKGRIRNNVWI